LVAGSKVAGYYIGDIYAFGIGVEKNTITAKEYYKISADHGLFVAKLRLLWISRSKNNVFSSAVFHVRIFLIFIRVVLLKFVCPNDWRFLDLDRSSGAAVTYPHL